MNPTPNARRLRREQIREEQQLWRALRPGRFAGFKFRRQHPFEPYVLDFYCHELKLAIQVDGGQHNEPAGRVHDARRDAFLVNNGIRTLRFWNNQVLAETEAVLEAVYQAVMESQAAEPSPSLSRRERVAYIP